MTALAASRSGATSPTSWQQPVFLRALRAAINRPALLLADEPTAALDDDNARAAIQLLAGQADAVSATLVVASHDGRIRDQFEHRYDLGAPA